MRKLTGPKKIKTAVFISGKGSNLKNLIKFAKNKKYPFSVDLIFSNTKKAKGLKYSKICKIKPSSSRWMGSSNCGKTLWH